MFRNKSLIEGLERIAHRLTAAFSWHSVILLPAERITDRMLTHVARECASNRYNLVLCSSCAQDSRMRVGCKRVRGARLQALAMVEVEQAHRPRALVRCSRHDDALRSDRCKRKAQHTHTHRECSGGGRTMLLHVS